MRSSRSSSGRVIAALAAAGIAVLLFPGVASASRQPQGGFKWWQTQKQELGLTDDQASKIDAVFQAASPQLRQLYRELDRLEDTLSKMIADGVAGEAAVVQQVDRVEAARSAMSKARTLMLYRMRQVLTPAQRAKLHEIHEHQKQRDRGKKPDKSPNRR